MSSELELRLPNGIPFVSKRSRQGKRVRIILKPDGSVVLTRPFFVSEKKALAFLYTKADWVAERVAALKRLPASFLHAGSQEEYKEHKEQARVFVLERLRHYKAVYGVTWSKLAIRNQKTRFGSCSATGTLSFSYRLLFLPPHLADYVVVHELCHLREMNHSPRFWALVAQTFPDYRTLRRELKLL